MGCGVGVCDGWENNEKGMEEWGVEEGFVMGGRQMQKGMEEWGVEEEFVMGGRRMQTGTGQGEGREPVYVQVRRRDLSWVWEECKEEREVLSYAGELP